MGSTDQKEFLVFSGGNDRAVLAFLRALGLCGRRAHIVARTRYDRILATRYHEDVVWTRENHELDLSIFVGCVENVRRVTGEKPLVVLPSTEYFNSFLLSHRTAIERLGCEVPLVDAAVYDLLTRKISATAYFASKGIAVPREIAPTADMQPPVVAKPSKNVTEGGRSLYPQLLLSRAQIDALYAQSDAGAYFFQEYVRGDSLYLLLYLPRDGGEPLTWSQRNLLQQPGGKSMLLAEPADLHYSESTTKFIQALREAGFWGIGMIEVIRTEGRDVFIEMNPRIWGPVQLTLDQGQPLLQAMIGEALHADHRYFLDAGCTSGSSRKRYFWLGGLLDTLASRGQPVWHGEKRSLASTIVAGLRNDVYLRGDSWRCFFREAADALKLAWHRDRTQD